MKSLSIVATTLAILISFLVNAQSNRMETFDSRWKTDTSKRNVELDEFWLGLPRDGFTVLENPPFIEKEEALAIYLEHEPVISVEIKGKAKGYPLNILTYHEVANDYLRDRRDLKPSSKADIDKHIDRSLKAWSKMLGLTKSSSIDCLPTPSLTSKELRSSGFIWRRTLSVCAIRSIPSTKPRGSTAFFFSETPTLTA